MKITIPRDAVRESHLTPKRPTRPIAESESESEDERELIDCGKKQPLK